jgi:general secretion pathway protein C
MSTRWWTLGVWAAAAASALYWGLKLFVAPPPLPPRSQVAELGAAARGDLSRLLGVDAPVAVATTQEPPADARFQLVGVFSPLAARAAGEGLALIAVDGKPAKAFRVGAVVEGQTVLQAVSTRSAKLGPRDGATQVALNIAPPAPAATGTLPLANSPGNPGTAGLPNNPAAFAGGPHPMTPQSQMLNPPSAAAPSPPGLTRAQRRALSAQQQPAQQDSPDNTHDQALPPPQSMNPNDPSNLR